MKSNRCPLCHNNKYFVLKEHGVEKLRKLWKNGFDYDPFPREGFVENLERIQCTTCALIYHSPAYFGERDFYEKISSNNWYYEQNKWEFDAAIEILQQKEGNLDSLLEIGSGDGAFLKKVVHAVEHVEGLEINKKGIDESIEMGLRVSSKDLGSLDRQYDAIVSFEVFEHLDSVEYFFENSIKRLNMGGVLLIAVPNPDSHLKNIDTNILDLSPHHNLAYPKRTFEFIANKYNLTLTNYLHEPMRYLHYRGLFHALMDYNDSISADGLIDKIVRKMRSLVYRMFSPLTYHIDKGNIIGQTHLVVFRKK